MVSREALGRYGWVRTPSASSIAVRGTPIFLLFTERGDTRPVRRRLFGFTLHATAVLDGGDAVVQCCLLPSLGVWHERKRARVVRCGAVRNEFEVERVVF